MKFSGKKILRIAVVALLLLAVSAPVELDARKRSSKATTTASTKKSKSTNSTKKSKSANTTKKAKTAKTSKSTATTTTSRRRRSNTTSVTQQTRDVAIKASSGRSAQGSQASGKKGKSGSSLLKIEVDKPDLEEIRVATLDPANKYYFPKLMAKYQKNDTTMTQEEYRYLYLGYMFQEDYDPYRESPYAAVTEELRYKKEHTREEVDTIRKYAEKALLDNPFDLRQMSFLVHVLKERRKDMSAKIWEYRLEHLLGAIKSTGTGEDVDNAWFVIYPMHEYDIVQLLGYEAVDYNYVEPGFDYLMVQPDGTVKHRSPAKGFYFNVQVPQQQYELKHPEDATDHLGADQEEEEAEE